MYGMVNFGIQNFIVGKHGLAKWQEICARAGMDGVEFESMLSYDDAITDRLIEAVGHALGIDAPDVLNVFGEYWIEYAGGTALGRIIDFGGSTFIEVLDSLDEMHERFKASMPHLRPPSFEVEEISDAVFRLHYQSDRDGLSPMVVGLLFGLARLHDEEINVRHLARKAAGTEHDIFEIVRLAKTQSSDVAA